ncbi:hypothetical protein DTO013E5_1934 [Penicillium roqueforti]|uniref:Genomic scaffold, ProqFM164S02 n=1 Tax=Penicillium roqueforti (strain FM164) TaxID=1365484 RepID=W6QQK8_PENRF|nr:hypothetical protein CBS147354_7018 [Penicillium roqueforti]CDM31822.1 unnamed protein product [Penicillium roqueforti FM164]KAI2741080.1 hypothetical protein DTO012A1_4854 [Penicillium roqueforti]KAI2748774.1 hypothetical protein DTO013F2_6267 [Penicillium roqueforti]KAI2774367.1 hypothetical protein DTO012A8_1185 [Penicillium roqueforti]
MEELNDQQLLPFVKYSKKDRTLDTLHLTLKIEGDSTADVGVDDPIYKIPFTITQAADDPQTRPCIIHWNPLEDSCGPSGTILLYHQTDSHGTHSLELKEVEDPKTAYKAPHSTRSNRIGSLLYGAHPG